MNEPVRPTCGTCPHYHSDRGECLFATPVAVPAGRSDRPYVRATTPGCGAHPHMAAFTAEWQKRSEQTEHYATGESPLTKPDGAP